MHKIIAVIFLIISIFYTETIFSAEKESVCAKQGNGHGYKVEATILNGSELNQETNTSNYLSSAKYVVIFWSQEEVSIIRLDFPFVTIAGTDGEDQQGRKWEISKSSLCF